MKVPENLVRAIDSGTCVAFVGAGFAAAAGLPSWVSLLRAMGETEGVGDALRAQTRALGAGPSRPSAHLLDQAAQMVADALGEARFVARLRELVSVEGGLPERMKTRLHLLQAIPFRAILTTNFDPLLEGEVPSGRGYRELLRNERSHWWQSAFWDRASTGAPTLKLHGDLAAERGEERIVFTREDYRRRLYGDASYMTFLRSMLSTSTVLFLGCSFEDAYLNELRSEILALFGGDARERPVAYAVLNDVEPVTEEHFLRHEGIHVLGFDSRDPAGFEGFDQWLAAIHDRTSPRRRLGEVLRGKRILWMDPLPENNGYGASVLRESAEAAGGVGGPIVAVKSPRTAAAALEKAAAEGRPFDLVITHWGERRGREPRAVTLLRALRKGDIRVPAIVFSSEPAADARKPEALALGAQAYCFRFETLFQKIEEVLSPGSKTG